MVIRRVRAKTRTGTGGRPKKTESNKMETSKLGQFDALNRVVDPHAPPMQSIKMHPDFNHAFNHNGSLNGNYQQINVMNSFGQNGNSSTSTTETGNAIDFNFPLFFDGVHKVDPMGTLGDLPMPKLIADGDVKHEVKGMDFVKMERKAIAPKVECVDRGNVLSAHFISNYQRMH